jgi:hypothetical protein
VIGCAVSELSNISLPLLPLEILKEPRLTTQSTETTPSARHHMHLRTTSHELDSTVDSLTHVRTAKHHLDNQGHSASPWPSHVVRFVAYTCLPSLDVCLWPSHVYHQTFGLAVDIGRTCPSHFHILVSYPLPCISLTQISLPSHHFFRRLTVVS